MNYIDLILFYATKAADLELRLQQVQTRLAEIEAKETDKE